MSGKSCASGSMRSCAGSVRLGTAGGHEVVMDALYERKRDKKSVRVLTVIIYVFCVSLAAIMLSLYYVFFWEPKDAHYAQRKVSHTVDQQTSTTPMPTCFLSHTGGSNITVNEVDTMPLTAEVHEDFANTSGTPNDVSEPDLTLPDSSPTALYNDTTDDMINNHTGMAT
ncbi:uncharacterized protein LOC106129416 isoform X1 [Amyelois transitella]|uniref:uncharacterized protein LOC106129416 isoform X1 n=1 Tax=Amyelois transitella TaxID=680683 RepID=UPI00067C5E3D|nr:uncharacterized protein LOC106129416 isoform X1 [Amyelois transitella]